MGVVGTPSRSGRLVVIFVFCDRRNVGTRTLEPPLKRFQVKTGFGASGTNPRSRQEARVNRAVLRFRKRSAASAFLGAADFLSPVLSTLIRTNGNALSLRP
jgi:hypothetical protein